MNEKVERPQPYIGVSGVVCHHNVQPSGLVVVEPQEIFLEAYAEKAGVFDTGRQLALGVKATHKSQYLDTENKYGREWYPVGEQEFVRALGDKDKHPRTLGVAQTYLDINHVGDAEYRRDFIAKIASRGQKWLQAVQFDMLPWNRDDEYLEFLDEIHEAHNLQVLLQCHSEAMEQLGPEGVVAKLGRYAANIDYVLFDASHGTGKRLDVARLDGFLEEAYMSDELAGVGFAVAGGLNAQIVREDLPRLIAKYPDLSWDAEGQLHPVNNVGKRPLQMDIVKNYLKASVATITE